MKRIFNYTITEEYNSTTIDHYLKAHEYTHNVIVALKKTPNGILLNGTWAYVTNRLKTGDTLTISLIEDTFDESIEPIQLPLDIIYEDEDLLVINKPSNMPIHPSMKNHDNTVANALMYYFRQQNEAFTFRCINRLDRDTTGLSIIAKHSLSAGILSQQVSRREIKRTYLAICQGNTDEAGTIDAPIARKDGSTIERCVDLENGERAVTHYKKNAYSSQNDLSLIELKLETGRTHQIRVHMKHIGHPLIGDFLYNPDTRYIERQALHSYSLSFVHPITKEKMHFHAPLPWDMKCIFPSL